MVTARIASARDPIRADVTIQDGAAAAQPRLNRTRRAHGRRAKGTALLPRLLAILIACGPSPLFADAADDAFRDGIALYDAQEYEQAVTRFEAAVKLNPQSSEYHHWLGKSCGRAAEHAAWYRAIGLAQRTRDEFETAVSLDGGNIDALRDLMEYYRQAPAFLGGSREKAQAIQRRLGRLEPGSGD